MIDAPRALGILEHRKHRLAQCYEPHVRDLTAFVERIRNERGCGDSVPYFDPADGGVEAECLFVLEAPGRRAKESGFVSRNNPDESAKNWLDLNATASVPRHRTIIWNIVPWYVGADGRVRAVRATDIEQGWPYFCELLGMLPRLRVVVLVGRKAQKVESRLRAVRPRLRRMRCPHPSPQFINRKAQNRKLLLASLRKVAAVLT
jgi:uracil-DNA glycosylase